MAKMMISRRHQKKISFYHFLLFMRIRKQRRTGQGFGLFARELPTSRPSCSGTGRPALYDTTIRLKSVHEYVHRQDRTTRTHMCFTWPGPVQLNKTTVAATHGTLFTYVILGWPFPSRSKKISNHPSMSDATSTD